MKTRYFFLQLTVFFILAAFVAIHAADVSKNDILNASLKWIADNAIFKLESPDAIPVGAGQLTSADGALLPLWRVDLAPSGYLVMSSDDTLPPVVAFDTKGSFGMPAGHPLPSMLARQGEIFRAELERPRTRGDERAAGNRALWNALLNRTRAESTTPSTIVRQPMLATSWNQDAPYNYFCPSGSMYTERAVTGCVALAVAQMLKYHEWPVAGAGTKTHTDGEGAVQGTLKADFSVPYDWASMAASYQEKEEREYGAAELSVARLAMEAGVLVEADYGLDETSAGSWNLHTLMSQYLGYSDSAVYGDTRSGMVGHVAQSTLYSRIRTDMTAGRPAFVSFDGHTFIADGLGTMGGQDYYHFNYGWGGQHDGWYLLTDGDEGTVVVAATTNVQPRPVAVFKPTSREQASSFTLSWDFPKRLTAEAFRLTKTTGTRASTVISSSISGTARSYTLSEQSGTATYMLEAKVGGSWQAASNGVTVTIKTNPVAMLSLSQVMEEGGDDGRTSIAGETATMMFEANNSLASLTVTSSRPDILPDSGISVTGSGKKRTIQLTPFNDKIGNVLLYVTACDAAGNIIRQTIPFKVMAEEVLTWYTSKAEAMTAATEKGKRVLLVTGHDGCYYTNNFRNSVCEISDIKADLLANYVLWYCNLYISSEYSPYVSGLGNTFPWIAIIDPANSGKRMRGHGGPVSAAETRMFLNKSIPYFSLNTNKTYDFGSKQTLELSILAKDADIYYRLDDQEPTPSDTLYSTPIQLTETTTVSACAYKNGVPLDDYVTKTYNFSTLTELPDGLSIVTGTGVTMYSTTKPWALQTRTYNSAPSAMQSGSIGDDATSMLVAKVIGSGTLTFYWKASCENGYDILSFSIDGTSKASISGLTEWAKKSYTVTGAGEHYLIWTYAKDSSDYENDDCGWVDDIVWNGNGPVLKTITINGDSTIASGATATYTCTAKWSDGTTSTVTPTWSLSSTTYASLSSGKVTSKNTTTTDRTVKLNASYTSGDVTATDSKSITLSKPNVVKYALTVVNGTGGGEIAAGGNVTVTANIAPEGQEFDQWEATGITLTETQLNTNPLTFEMPANDVTMTAKFKASVQNQLISLSSGWNWVGFQILPTSHKVSDVLGTAGFTANDVIQSSNGSSRFTGTSWIPSSFTIEYGKLYMISVSNPMTVTVSGTGATSTSLTLSAGWNWIANPTTMAITPSQLKHSAGWSAGDCIQGASGSVTYSGSKWIPSTGFKLEAGKGYQIRSAKAGTVAFTTEGGDDVDALYVVVDLSNGPDAESYPVRYTNTAPNLNENTCRTTELWLRRIPAGTFIMGSPEDEVGHWDDETQHEVTLTQDYYIGVFECTQKQWELVMGNNPSAYIGDVRPVEQVSYDMIRGTSATAGAGWPVYGHAVDSTSFMGKLQTKTGLIFDLPTEAQWEYACRAGTTTALNSGRNLTNDEEDAYINEVGRYYYNRNKGIGGYVQHTKVGSFQPNAWGLYDMHGNMYEWCLDWYDDYSMTAVEDPIGPSTGSERVARGGFWYSIAFNCRTARRSNSYPSYDGVNCTRSNGFRVTLHLN